VGDVLYTMGGFDDAEYVIALDLTKPKPTELWRRKVGKLFSFQAWGDGPRSTPTLGGDRLYALGACGDLVCLDLKKKGDEIWRKRLVTDLDGELMTGNGASYGFSESILVDGDSVICTPGGAKGTLAALDKKTGDVRWRSAKLKNQAPYSSVIVAEIQGVRQYVQNGYVDDDTGGVISGVRAKDGELLWYEPMLRNGSYAIASTPI